MRTNAAIADMTGRKWDPFQTDGAHGFVTYTPDKGEIHVPYGTDPVSKTIQAHELSHVRYTSKLWRDVKKALRHLQDLTGTTSAIIGYAEDMRITALAGRLGVKTLPAFGDKLDQPIIKRWVESFVKVGIPQDRVQRAVRFILTEHTTVLDTLGLSLDSLQQRANAERYINHCARFLHDLLTTGKDDSPKQEDDGDKGKSKAPKADNKPHQDEDKSSGREQDDEDTAKGPEDDDDEQDGEPEDGDEGEPAEGDSPEAGESDTEDGSRGEGEGTEGPHSPSREIIDLHGIRELPDIREAMLKSVPAPVDEAKLTQEFQHLMDTADWIPVTGFQRMPLVRRVAHSRRRGRKLGEQGTVLGSAYDAVAPNERRPFVAKRKGGAGGVTVVIDCSGSMMITNAQLETLLTAHPQGVVVTYSSYTSGSSNRAIVRVIASHGRVAAPEDCRDMTAGGNGCDGPMLEWLAKQSGERVWVCDGIITGKNDRPVHNADGSYGVSPAMEAWLKAHRITRFGSMKDYLNSL